MNEDDDDKVLTVLVTDDDNKTSIKQTVWEIEGKRMIWSDGD